jgi:hypothetical protein
MTPSVVRAPAFLAVVASVLILAPAALASAKVGSGYQHPPTQTAPTLTDEVFVGSFTITSSNCSPTGSSFSFASSGTATGPYRGTYTESGTVTLPDQGVGTIPSSFHASFTISPDPALPATFQQVTGTKTIGDPTAGDAGCLSPTFSNEVNLFRAFIGIRYTARITLPGGATCNDGGVGSLTAESFDTLAGVHSERFNEGFASDSATASCGATCDENHEEDFTEDDGESCHDFAESPRQTTG